MRRFSAAALSVLLIVSGAAAIITAGSAVADPPPPSSYLDPTFNGTGMVQRTAPIVNTPPSGASRPRRGR